MRKNAEKKLWAVLICGKVEKVFDNYEKAVEFIRNWYGPYWFNYDCGVVRYYED